MCTSPPHVKRGSELRPRSEPVKSISSSLLSASLHTPLGATCSAHSTRLLRTTSPDSRSNASLEAISMTSRGRSSQCVQTATLKTAPLSRLPSVVLNSSIESSSFNLVLFFTVWIRARYCKIRLQLSERQQLICTCRARLRGKCYCTCER